MYMGVMAKFTCLIVRRNDRSCYQHCYVKDYFVPYPKSSILGTRGSLAARFREMSGTAEGRPTVRRPATSDENIRDIRGA